MLINVMIGGRTEFNEQGQPYNVGGTLAVMESDELSYKTYSWDNEDEAGTAHEYWEGAELRHRSVDLKLKKPLELFSKQGSFR